MGRYGDDPKWDDIIPIPQDDGCSNPLAAIAYTEEYSEAMAYLRAVMAAEEMSDRVLDLTQDIIRMNPAHYTVWLYRATVVFKLEKDLLEELKWLNEISMKHLKNYQIWYKIYLDHPETLFYDNTDPNIRHHRQTIMSHIDKLPDTELGFLDDMFAKDAKNYHVWSYRQWLVRHFSLWDDDSAVVDRLLDEDVRNNSAWNHRYFLIFGRNEEASRSSHARSTEPKTVSRQIIDREIEYAQAKIALAPQNQSPWSYLKGVVANHAGRDLTSLKAIAQQYADVHQPAKIRSSHALDLLAEIYAQEKDAQASVQALELLATKYDPIRRNYWNYRKSLLQPLPVN